MKIKKDRAFARSSLELSPFMLSNTVYQRIKVGLQLNLTEILRSLKKG